MPNRILKDSICTSPNIDALSLEAETFFYRLLVQCDDYGRMDARPAILRARCYPLRLDAVTDARIGAWLAELASADLVVLYSVDGRPYLQMRTWERHQQVRAKSSKYPPMKSSDSRCDHVQSNVPEYEYESVFENPKDIIVVVAPPPLAESAGESVQPTPEPPARATPPALPTAPPEPAPPPTDGKSAANAAVYRCWQDNMPGALSAVIADDLGDLIDDYGPEMVIRAIGESARANVRNMRYITGILKNWSAGNSKPQPATVSAPNSKPRASPSPSHSGRGQSKVERSLAAVETVRQMMKQQEAH